MTTDATHCLTKPDRAIDVGELVHFHSSNVECLPGKNYSQSVEMIPASVAVVEAVGTPCC